MNGAELLVVLGAGALAGLAAIPHCAGMCGPLAAFACTRRPVAGAPLRYQAGRTASYAIAGAVAGGFGGAIAAGLSPAWGSALLSWSLAIALGVAAWRLWAAGSPRRAAGARVSLGRGPARRSLFDRALSRMPRDPAVFGFLTALLPCGALAAALLIAAGSASALGGVAVMVGFATASSLALLGVAWLAQRVRGTASPRALRLLSVALMVGAVLLVVRPIGAITGEPDACCEALGGA